MARLKGVTEESVILNSQFLILNSPLRQTLHLDKFGIDASLGHQFAVGTLLGNTACVDYDDAVSIVDGTHAGLCERFQR